MAPKAKAACRKRQRKENTTMAWCDYDIRQGYLSQEAHRGAGVREREREEWGARKEGGVENACWEGHKIYFNLFHTFKNLYIHHIPSDPVK